jgi:hypothetical protein
MVWILECLLPGWNKFEIIFFKVPNKLNRLHQFPGEPDHLAYDPKRAGQVIYYIRRILWVFGDHFDFSVRQHDTFLLTNLILCPRVVIYKYSFYKNDNFWNYFIFVVGKSIFAV